MEPQQKIVGFIDTFGFMMLFLNVCLSITLIDTLMIHYMLFLYVFIKCNMKERPEDRSRRFRSPSGCRAKDHDSGRVFAKTGVKIGFQDELKQEPPHISCEKTCQNVVNVYDFASIQRQQTKQLLNMERFKKNGQQKLDSTPNMWMVKES